MRIRFLLLLALGCSPGVFSKEKVIPFLENYCLECHDSDVQKGDIDLEPLYDALVIQDPGSAILWHDVMDQLNLDEMPPAKSDQPTDAETLDTIAWISDKLDDFYTDNEPEDSQSVLRRLNKVEYQNTIRDLLYVDFEPGERFPADSTLEGFDNIGEALTVSTTLFERYLESAEEIAEKAIAIGPKPERKSQRHLDRQLDCELGIRKSTGFELASNREARARVFPKQPVPVEGNYRVRFRVFPVRSKGKKLGVKLKTGQPDRELTVPLKFEGEFFFTEAKEFEQTLFIPEGSTAHISFSNGSGIPTISAQWNHKGQAAVIEWIEIEGPLIEQWPPRSDRELLKPANGKTDFAAAERVLRAFAHRAFRRPTSDEMIRPLLETYREERKAGKWFREALRSSVQVALCSPYFLYVNSPSGNSDSKQLNDFEIANRLSYFIWSSMPDAALMEEAAAGTLTSSPESLAAQLDRMLADPRSQAFYENFVGQWLQTRRIGDMPPDPRMFPQWDNDLEIAVRAETEEFVRHLISEDLPIDNVLDSDFAMLNERLARHYGIPGVKGAAFRPVPLKPEHRRGGVIGQASFLTVTSNGTNTSPVIRGIYVLENILGTPPQPPPPDVDPIEPDTRGTTTIREQLAKHREVATCFDCHQRIDPLGLALEAYDPIGALRTHYRLPNPKKPKGPPVLTDTETADGTPLAGEEDLRAYLRDRSHLFARGLTEKLLIYGTGRELSYFDEKSVEDIVRQLPNSGSGFRTLLHCIVESEAFHRR